MNLRKFLPAAALALLGVSASATTVISSDITTNTHWTTADNYVLDGIIYVKNGATLTIDAGVVIRGQPNDAASSAYNPGTLVVTRGAKLDALGDPGNPIIFTTAAVDANSDGVADGYSTSSGTPRATRWTSGQPFLDANPATSPLGSVRGLAGGVIILGKAPTNTDLVQSTVDVVDYRNIEGLPTSADGLYGGDQPHDNSGRIAYWSIRHGGSNLSAANEINGLTLGGVGDGTEIHHVEVYFNRDDGFEFFGGTVNTSYLVAIGVDDDCFDLDEGHVGHHQFWFGVGGPETDSMCEWDGFESTQLVHASFRPATAPSIANATFIGNKSAALGNQNGIRIREDCGPSLYNSVLTNVKIALRVDKPAASGFVATTGSNNDGSQNSGVTDSRSKLTSGVSKIRSLTFFGNNTNLNSGTPDIITGVGVSVSNEIADPDFVAPAFNADGTGNAINPVPGAAGNGIGGNFYTVDVLPEPFVPVPYRGAFSDGLFDSLWTNGWTAAWKRGSLVSTGL